MATCEWKTQQSRPWTRLTTYKIFKPKCQSVLFWVFLRKQIKINMKNWTVTFQRYNFVYLIPGHTLGYPRWPQSRKQSWQWGTFHGFHRSTPAGPQHRSQTSRGKDNEQQVYCGTPDCIRTPKIVSNVHLSQGNDLRDALLHLIMRFLKFFCQPHFFFCFVFCSQPLNQTVEDEQGSH